MTANKLWYEELLYKYNPFSIKPQLRTDLVSQTQTVQQIISAVSDGKFIVVEGNLGAGKTTLLKRLVMRFGGTRRVVYLSCNRLTGPLDIDRLLIERFGIISRTLGIKSRHMIVLLDEAHELSEQDIKNLRTYHQDGYLHAVMLVTHDRRELKLPSAVLLALKDSSFVLHELSPQDAITLIRSRIGKHPLLTDDVIVHIFNRDTRMRAFLKNCETFMRHMMAQKRKVAKPADADKILDEHRY